MKKKKAPVRNKILEARERIRREQGQLPIKEWQDIQEVLKRFKNIDLDALTAKQLHQLNDFFVEQSELTTELYDAKSKTDPAWAQSGSAADEETDLDPDDDEGDDDGESTDQDEDGEGEDGETDPEDEDGEGEDGETDPEDEDGGGE